MNKLQWKWNQNTKFFILENEFENIVCELVAICPGEDTQCEANVKLQYRSKSGPRPIDHAQHTMHK